MRVVPIDQSQSRFCRNAQATQVSNVKRRHGIYGRIPTVSYPLFVSDPWLFERAIWIDLATPVTGLGRKKRIYSRLVICLGARVW